MKNSTVIFDLIIIGILMYAIAYLFSNTESPLSSTETHYWSGDDTLKIMFVKDSAYIVNK